MAVGRKTRTSKLEFKTKVSGLLAIMVISANGIGILLTVYLYFNFHGTLDRRSGEHLVERINQDYEVFTQIESQASVSMATVRDLDASLDLQISQRNILDTTNRLYDSERDFQVFYRLLKVNIYYLVSQIPGTNSWYEIYGPEIDGAIERSQSRQLQLLQIRQYYDQLQEAV